MSALSHPPTGSWIHAQPGHLMRSVRHPVGGLNSLKASPQSPAVHDGGPPSPAQAWVLASLSLSMLLSSLGTSIANVGLPTLAHVFQASFAQVQWIVLAYLLTITSLVVSVGRLGDVMGRRRLLLLGIALFTVASGACAVAPTLGSLIAARAVQGMGAAVMMALTMAFVGQTVPKAKTGSAMGLLGTMSAVGTALGPSLGGLLIGALGWRALFWVNVPLGLLTWALAYRLLPVDRRTSGSTGVRFDHLGTVLLSFSLVAYALAMTLGRGHWGLLNGLLLMGAAAGLGLFVWVETRVSSPLLRPAMLMDPALSPGLAMSALVTTVVMASLVVGPFYLSGALGLGAAGVGLVMSCGPVVAALAGIPAGRIVDRFGAHSITVAGLVAMAVGAIVMAVVPMGWGVPGYIAPLAVITAGYAFFQAANNTAVMADVAADQRGVVSGLLTLSRNLGLVTGASAMGAVFAWGSASANVAAASASALSSGLLATFGVAAGLVFVALAIALAAGLRTGKLLRMFPQQGARHGQ